MDSRTQGMVSIPPDLDRELALTILADLRGRRDDADPQESPPSALDSVVARIVDALRAQGALPADGVLALDDAFAALLAGSARPVERSRTRVHDAHARDLVFARLGYLPERTAAAGF